MALLESTGGELVTKVSSFSPSGGFVFAKPGNLQICFIFKGTLLVRVAEGVGERWCWSSQKVYRRSARELCTSNGNPQYLGQKWRKAVGLPSYQSWQPCACFISIITENYLLKPNQSGVLIFMATVNLTLLFVHLLITERANSVLFFSLFLFIFFWIRNTIWSKSRPLMSDCSEVILTFLWGFFFDNYEVQLNGQLEPVHSADGNKSVAL